MKKILLLILLFIYSISFGQIQKLNKLSTGKYIDSEIIYDSKTEDLYGYFILYQIDTKKNNILQYEYIVLDKNLNKITTNTFEQQNYNQTLLKSDLIISTIKKIDNELLIEFCNLERIRRVKYHYRYRKLNLETFAFSDSFVILNTEVKPDEIKIDDSINEEDFIDDQRLQKTAGEYFIVYETPKKNKKKEKGILTENKRKSINGFSVLNKKLEVLWNRDFQKGYEYYINSDSTTFITYKIEPKSELITYSIYNKNNGYIADFPLYDENYHYVVKNISFNKNNIILNTTYNKFEKKNIKDPIGLAQIVLDKNTGKLVEKKYLPWKNFEPELKKIGIEGEFKKDTEIKNYGYLKIQDYQNLDNGNTIIIAEGYKYKATSGTVLDLFIIELDKDYKIKYFNKLDKNSTKIKIKNNYAPILRLLPFDYLYSQNLDNDGNFVFFYVNNEKEGSRLTKRKNPEWVLGIITYVDGEFNYDRLELTKKDSEIIPGIAKNGYIRLLEIEENGDTEIRLEKINY